MIPLFAAISAAPKPSPSTALNAIARSIGVCVAVPVGTSRINGAGRKLIERRTLADSVPHYAARSRLCGDAKASALRSTAAAPTQQCAACHVRRSAGSARHAQPRGWPPRGCMAFVPNYANGHRPKIRKAANPHAATPTSNIAQSEGLSSQRRPSLVSCAITPDTRHSRISAIQVKAASNSP